MIEMPLSTVSKTGSSSAVVRGQADEDERAAAG